MNKRTHALKKRVQENKKKAIIHQEDLTRYQHVLGNLEETMSPTDDELRLKTMQQYRAAHNQQQPESHDLLYRELIYTEMNEQIDLDMTLLEKRKMTQERYTRLASPVYNRPPTSDPWYRPSESKPRYLLPADTQ